MCFIENEILKVSIDTKGALLTSIIDKRNNEELLYQVQKDSWPFQDVVIFPVIGATTYKINDFNLSSPTRHGFIRNLEFEIVEETIETVTLKVQSNEETKLLYPYDFEFFITYSIENETLKVNTKVVNNTDALMYFMYGSHTAIKANSEAKLFLNKPYTQYKLVNGLIEEKETKIDSDQINLTTDYFTKEDTVIIKNESNTFLLKNGFNHDAIYTFEAPLFALWSKTNDIKFICLEPWWGISNTTNEVIELKDARYINEIKKEKEFTYSISFRLN